MSNMIRFNAIKFGKAIEKRGYSIYRLGQIDEIGYSATSLYRASHRGMINADALFRIASFLHVRPTTIGAESNKKPDKKTIKKISNF